MDPNIFIADTRASVYSTGKIQGFINNMKPEKIDSITLTDGTKTTTEIIADLRGTVCDNQGNRLTKCMLSKVRYSPRNKFNLFSDTNQLFNWWDLGRDGNSIWIRKNKQAIKFDINIKTKEGNIFAVYEYNHTLKFFTSHCILILQLHYENTI